MRHIVAVAEIGEFNAVELAERVVNGQKIGESLAGVKIVGKPVYDRKTSVLGKFLYVRLFERAYHNAVNAVPRKHASGVVYGFASAELNIVAR